MQFACYNFGGPCCIIPDARYINNPELSDVQFVIEGRVFYAHRIVLATTSSHFRNLLAEKSLENTLPTLRLDLPGMKYKMFEVGIWNLVQILHYMGACDQSVIGWIMLLVDKCSRISLVFGYICYTVKPLLKDIVHTNNHTQNP